jgi:hypothetical protein
MLDRLTLWDTHTPRTPTAKPALAVHEAVAVALRSPFEATGAPPGGRRR